MVKKLIIIANCVFLLIACKKNSGQNSASDIVKATSVYDLNDPNTYLGEFIFLEDAAVLTTKNEIYAVQIDDKMYELNELAKPLQKSKFDMVKVVLKGELKDNPLKLETGEGWDKMLVIDEVLEIIPPFTTGNTQDPQVIQFEAVK